MRLSVKGMYSHLKTLTQAPAIEVAGKFALLFIFSVTLIFSKQTILILQVNTGKCWLEGKSEHTRLDGLGRDNHDST